MQRLYKFGNIAVKGNFLPLFLILQTINQRVMPQFFTYCYLVF
ncbi:hypothetical protein L580_1279 [Serratia fonticola AU-P3(3)]|nr:hypothetical protein L580_1279 [Serratia fonticola AU-P3(3)]